MTVFHLLSESCFEFVRVSVGLHFLNPIITCHIELLDTAIISPRLHGQKTKPFSGLNQGSNLDHVVLYTVYTCTKANRQGCKRYTKRTRRLEDKQDVRH